MIEEINRYDVIAEVEDAFRRYNAAINSGDTEALNGFFWNSPHTVRFGPGENLFGYSRISAFRSGTWKAGPPRAPERVSIAALGVDVAVTKAVFRTQDGGWSRQSQTWARMPEGWRIVAAHVSRLAPE